MTIIVCNSTTLQWENNISPPSPTKKRLQFDSQQNDNIYMLNGYCGMECIQCEREMASMNNVFVNECTMEWRSGVKMNVEKIGVLCACIALHGMVSVVWEVNG